MDAVDVDLGSVDVFVDYDTTFTEGAEFQPIAGGADERGMVAVISHTDADGNEVTVTTQLAVSEDDDGRWWQVYSDRQTVMTPDGDLYERELSVGNVESVTFESEEAAWSSLQAAKGSLTFEHHSSVGNFEVADLDWYQPL